MNLGIRSTSRLVDRIVDDYSTNEIVDSGSTSSCIGVQWRSQEFDLGGIGFN